jgi:hypothetical protein
MDRHLPVETLGGYVSLMMSTLRADVRGHVKYSHEVSNKLEQAPSLVGDTARELFHD